MGLDLSQLTKDLDAALKVVADTKAKLEGAQGALDKSKDAYNDALNKARDLHGAFASQMAELIPGLK